MVGIGWRDGDVVARLGCNLFGYADFDSAADALHGGIEGFDDW